MNIDDPKFTAYALGETEGLSDADRAELDRMLAEDAEAQAAFEEIRSVSGALGAAFQSEPTADLTAEQKEAVGAGQSAEADTESAVGRTIKFPLNSILAAAACATIGLVVAGITLNRSRGGSDPVMIAEEVEKEIDAPVRDGVALDEGKTVAVDPRITGNKEDSNMLVAGTIDVHYNEAAEAETLIEKLVITDEPTSVEIVVDDLVEPSVIASAEEGVEVDRIVSNERDVTQKAHPREPRDSNRQAPVHGVSPPSMSPSSGATAEAEEELIALSEFSVDASVGPTMRAPGRVVGLAGGARKRERVTTEAYAQRSSIAASSMAQSYNGGAAAPAADITIYPPPHIPHPPHPHPPRRPYPCPIPPHPPIYWDRNTEEYDAIKDNPFYWSGQNPLSTLSIDVDTASYANVRRFLNGDRLPPPDAVRIEELINYFPYSYAGPDAEDGHPFAAHVEIASAPWQAGHRLVRIALKGREVEWKNRPPSNLVFLIDVSGSMRAQNKLPLVQKSLRMLVRRFDERDRIAIITYAGDSRVALPSTTANNTETILHAIDGLTAGGSTHASAGIEKAYAIAEKHFLSGGESESGREGGSGGNNRVILCTDGDFNVGVTNRGELVRIIDDNAKKGIQLSILGFGMGNYKDGALEELSNKGDGNYGYIDTQREARKEFVEQVSGTLLTIAKDVKIQVEFNPGQVQAYRLLGYENRKLTSQDFNDDTKDAGEIGAGHTVTAFYEVVPAGIEYNGPIVDPLKYQKTAGKLRAEHSNEMITVKLRYKPPERSKSVLMEIPVVDGGGKFKDASEDFRFGAAVASFGMVLRDSPYRGESTFASVREIAETAQGNNRGGYRSEFLALIDQAEMLVEDRNRDRDPVRPALLPTPMPEPIDPGDGPVIMEPAPRK